MINKLIKDIIEMKIKWNKFINKMIIFKLLYGLIILSTYLNTSMLYRYLQGNLSMVLKKLNVIGL